LLLTTVAEKKEVLAESGLEYAVFLPFTPQLARYEPRRFVEEILVGRLGVEELVIGYDHGFGRGREGDPDALRRFGAQHGFTVDVVEPIEAKGGAVSSSRLRAMVAAGEIADVRNCLGRPYSVRGVVVEGERKGRELGFPTANLEVLGPNKLLPGDGVYAVRADLRTGSWAGALHIGPRPTFEGFTPTVEVHLIDFDGDIYGEEIRLDFVKRLRGIEPFTTIEALVTQIGRDVQESRRALAAEPWQLSQ
jgi:riboflavin kinase/FMN adenylyltransferase